MKKRMIKNGYALVRVVFGVRSKMSKPRVECPECKKTFINLKQHITKSHNNSEVTIKMYKKNEWTYHKITKIIFRGVELDKTKYNEDAEYVGIGNETFAEFWFEFEDKNYSLVLKENGEIYELLVQNKEYGTMYNVYTKNLKIIIEKEE